MANQNLQEIKLGAPSSIVGGASPNAELSVQLMSRCAELTLHDAEDGTPCTRDGALMTAIRLLRQRVDEATIKESTWEGMTAHYGSNLADVMSNGGELQLSVLDADGNSPKVYWDIAEIIEAEEGATVTVDQDGLLTLSRGKKIQGKVRAMNWDNSREQVIFYFAVYSGLGTILSQHPEYIDLLVECPSFINSLSDTGKRSFIRQQTDSNSGYINTGIICSADMSFDAVVRSELVGGNNCIFGGGGSTVANRMYLIHNLNGVNHRAYFRYSGTENQKTDALWNEGFHTYAHDVSQYGVDGVMTARAANISSFVVKETSPICIFGAMNNDNGTSYSRNTSEGNTIDIERLIIRNKTDVHTFVPFIRNGEHGIIDLFDCEFYCNNYTAGSFTVITEII